MRPTTNDTQDRPLQERAEMETPNDVFTTATMSQTPPSTGEADQPALHQAPYSFDASCQELERRMESEGGPALPPDFAVAAQPVDADVYGRAIKVVLDVLRAADARGLYMAASIAANHPTTRHRVPSIVGAALWTRALEVVR